MKRSCLSRVHSLSALGLGLIVSLLLPLTLRGQEPPAQGGFRFVNASAIAGKAILTIENAKLRPDGFGPGENTGIIGILAGAHHFNIVHPTTGKADATVTVQPNLFTTVVAYTKPVVDPQTRKVSNQIQLLVRGDPPRDKGKHFQVLSVSSRQSLAVTINGQAVNLTPLRELKADDAAKGSIKIEYAGKPVIDFVAQESGSFLTVVFDRPDGTVGAVLMPDYG